MEIAPHLHRIGNDIVAAYLVDTADGVTVIDAGLPGHWRELISELTTLGKSLDDVRGVVLTHGDTDHIGFAERLRRETGVPVYVHSADAERARGLDKPQNSFGDWKLAATMGFFAYCIRKGGLRTNYLEQVEEVSAGDVLPLPGAPQIVGIPGHSPGSIAIYIPAVGALCVGDALTSRHVLTGVRGPQPAPFTDDPVCARDSLTQLTGIQAEWVLPGHGAPLHEAPSAVVNKLIAS